ncbi:MAG TPA: hypothetical protein VNR70_01440 [Steroidobacteraceae bacterium]|nr:hypothetical protein [Steroidobacteraceae bacterium]
MHTEKYISDDLSDRLSAFGASVEGTSLYLLRAIETTVDNLEAGERLARAVSENANLLITMIGGKKRVVGQMLDPDDKVINELETAYHGLEQHLPKMLLKKNCIDDDDQLDEGHCEVLHTAYDRHIEAFARLIESAKNLRAAIITHDLAAEPRSQRSFEELDVVISELRSSPAA